MIHNTFLDKVIEHGILILGRVQFIVFQIDVNLRICILICIYAYNDSIARMHLWKTIHEIQLPQALWILCGNFIQIEDICDRIGGEPHTRMNPQEINEWQKNIIHVRLTRFLLFKILY